MQPQQPVYVQAQQPGVQYVQPAGVQYVAQQPQVRRAGRRAREERALSEPLQARGASTHTPSAYPPARRSSTWPRRRRCG